MEISHKTKLNDLGQKEKALIEKAINWEFSSTRGEQFYELASGGFNFAEFDPAYLDRVLNDMLEFFDKHGLNGLHGDIQDLMDNWID